MSKRGVGLCILLFCLIPSCTNAPESQSVLDKGPRIPDDEGVVTSINFETVTIGPNTYEIRDDVESFTTREHNVTPLLHWKDRYVHLGLDEKREVLWIAGIGVVSKTETPEILYSGVFSGTRSGRAIFKDGTALLVPKALSLPRKGQTVVVAINPSNGQITRFENQ